VTEQLHGILDRMFQFDSADAVRQPHAAGNSAADATSDQEYTEAIRLFSCVKEGTAVVLDRPQETGGKRTSWSGKLKAMRAAHAACTTQKVTPGQARSVAVDAVDLIHRADAIAAAASRHTVHVLTEVDSDSEAWRGGVKPGSSIQRCLKQPKAKKKTAASGAVRGDATTDPPRSAKKKRKGKKEREREKLGCGREVDVAANTLLPAADTTAAEDDEAAKLERKRAKRRQIKKRKRNASKEEA